MQFWSNLLFILQILSAMAMIGLVLIQHGKGADMGASFGSGASGSLFGATGSANFLSRSTAICATVFFATTLGMSVLSTGRGSAHAAEASRLDAATPAIVASAPVSGASAAVLAPASAPSGVQGIPTR
ncbi:MAG: preprotein translocase subunit SecG [Burkholderiaceae bacterium]|jgi:preprotein translocase subunit SecG